MPKHFLELWTRPGDSSFGRSLDELNPATHTVSDDANDVGSGSLQVPDTFDQLDKFLKIDGASSVSSMVRVFSESDPTTPVFEWLPNSILPTTSKTDRLVDISGAGIKSILSYAKTKAYDWDGSPSHVPIDPDWSFGAGRDLISNGSFERQTAENGGFELGNTFYWQPTNDTTLFNLPTFFGAVLDQANAQSGSYYATFNPTTAYSGVERSFGNLVPGETYTITGYLREPGASGLTYRMGVYGASSASHTNAYEEDGFWWADLGNAAKDSSSSTNTWQLTTLTFVATGDQVRFVIVYSDAGNGPETWVDTWTISGQGSGLDPWAPFTQQGATVDQMSVSSAEAHSGSQSMAVQVTDVLDSFGNYNNARVSYPVSLQVGRTYTATMWVKHNSGSNEGISLYIRRVGRIAGSTPFAAAWVYQEVPTATWTKYQITFVADFEDCQFQVMWRDIPGAATQSPVFYVDDVSLIEGLAATTIGGIISPLYDHATDGTLRSTIVWDDGAGSPYLTLDFDESQDSGGNAWFDSEISFRVFMRMSLLQVITQLASIYGYEWRVVPDDVEAGTWKLQIYNPGGMKTDYTSAQSPAIQGGSRDVVRQVRRILPATSYMVEGAGRITADDDDAGLVSALGVIESARLVREITSVDAVQLAAYEDATQAEKTGNTYSYRLVDPVEQPLTAYLIGDALWIEDPPEVSGSARLVAVFGSFDKSGEDWTVSFEALSAEGS